MMDTAAMKMRVLTKRHGKTNVTRDASTLLRTINRLRRYSLIPKGVFRFTSHKEADEWMTKEIAKTRALMRKAHLGDKADVQFLKIALEEEGKKRE
jgi:hypothetical protein